MDKLAELEMAVMVELLKNHESRLKVLEAAMAVSLIAVKELQEEVSKLKGLE